MSGEQPVSSGLSQGQTGELPLSGAITPLTGPEQQLHDDYEWCLHDPEVRKAYGGKVVAAHLHRVWGVGADHATALRAALASPGCPSRQTLAVVVVPEEPTHDGATEGTD